MQSRHLVLGQTIDRFPVGVDYGLNLLQELVSVDSDQSDDCLVLQWKFQCSQAIGTPLYEWFWLEIIKFTLLLSTNFDINCKKLRDKGRTYELLHLICSWLCKTERLLLVFICALARG